MISDISGFVIPVSELFLPFVIFVYFFFQKFIFLVSLRWYSYKRIREHYFLCDFCYFTHTLVLIYVWSPWKLGWLFPMIYAFSMGPIIFAQIVYRNSLVHHSMDKMTSVFIHSSPINIVWGFKWYILLLCIACHQINL